MRKSYLFKGLLGLFLAIQAFSASAQELEEVQLPTSSISNQNPDEKAYHDDKIFVKFRQLETGTALEFNGKSERARSLKDDKVSKALLKADARLMRQAAGKGFGQSVSRIFQVELDGSRASVKQLVNELKAMPEVEYAELVPIYYIHAAPSDQRYSAGQQYSLDITKAVQAYSAFNGNGGLVKVAIVDDAVLTTHPDLKANIWTNPGETGLDALGRNKATNGIDDDGNGYIDDVNGWDSADRDNNPNPPVVATANGNLAGPNTFSHGTHCAGIAGAVTNNGAGIASVSNNRVQIVPVKCTYNNAANTRSINTSFDGLAYAIRGARAHVVSMSFGGSGYSQAFQDLITEGAAMGTVFIGSAGNNNNNIEQYPANYEHVISVSNTDAGDKKSSSSSFGNWVTIAAPGTNIMSTVAGTGTAAQIAEGSYINYTGTSMSGPMVAGLVGYIRSQNPSLTPAQIRQILVSTADNVDVLNSGFEGLLGAGRINAYQAIVAAGGSAFATIVDFISNKTSAVIGEEVAFANRSIGDNLTYAWTFQNANIATSSAKNPVVRFTSAGLHEVTLSINGGVSKTMVINVSGFTSLDILGLPLAGTVGASGINGHSTNNIPAIANFYKYGTTHLIAGVNISFRLATAGSANSTIRVKVWESERGVPGKVLHTETIKISDLKANGLVGTLRPNYFYFDKPVQVPANSSFYIGIEYDYGKNDNISIHHVNSPAKGTDAAVFFNNTWQINAQVGIAWTFAMFPIMAESAEYPAGAIVASTTEACVSKAVDFSGADISNAGAYRWNFGNGTSSTEAVASATYAAVGTFNPTLTTARFVSITKGGTDYPVELRQTFTKMLRVADCGLSPMAAFEASALSANVGSSITFNNATTNATSYEWTISQGGTKITSTEESPVVTFNTKGKYDVTLITRNPGGEVSQSTKKQYIEVFTAGQDCGTVDFPFASRLTSFGTAAGGTFSGHNGYKMANYAKSFDLTAGTVVTKAMLNILTATATAPAASFITVRVWDATGLDGNPGQVISSAQVSYTKLMQAIATNGGNLEVVLDQHVVVPADGRIYVGFTINYTAGDNMALGSKLAGPNMGDRSLLFYGGEWNSIKALVNIQTEFAIGVSTFSNIDKLPIANFTASATTVAAGEAIKLDASLSKKAQVYNWQVTGGTLTAMGQNVTSAVYDPTKAAVTFSKAGTYNVTLVVTGDCDAKVATKTMQVVVTAPAIATVTTSEESKAADVTDLSVNEAVVYPNPSNGQFNVVLKGEAQQQVMVSVSDMTGKQLSRKQVTLAGNSEVHQLDLGNNPAGLYLLRITTGNKVQILKIVKK